MDSATRDNKSSSPLKTSKFNVYQNPALSAALTANSLQPSKFTFLFIFSVSTASALALISFISRENGLIDVFRFRNLSQQAAYLFAKAMQTVFSVVFLGAMFALFKAISLHRVRTSIAGSAKSPNGTKDQSHLTKRQLELLGVKPKADQVVFDSSKKPPKSKPVSPLEPLVPLHQPISNFSHNSRVSLDKPSSGSGNKMNSFGTPSKSQGSPSSFYLSPGSNSLQSSVQTSPGRKMLSPWSNKRSSSTRMITTEEQFEQFLAEVDEKMIDSAEKLGTPSPTIRGFSIGTPNAIASAANTPGTARSTPLRSVRMSPGSQKFTTPPKKGEGDFPQPMAMEESVEGYRHLNIYPQIEQWRDHLRQWFSSMLLKPLLLKIESSHIQVMQAAAKLGISVTVSQVGSDLSTSGTPTTTSSTDRTKEWQPAYTLNEDGILNQLRSTLLQTIDASMGKLPLANQQQSPQQNAMVPIMQECLDAITEHQRLQALMKGEWVKGLLPQSSIQADYTVQRIRELAEGTCVKNYEYLRNGEVCEKNNKKWNLELPTDSHLLLYLFCAFLEHPKWMLHVDPTSYMGAQSSKNPLFLGVLPPKETFPEKYVAVVSTVPSTLHPGACILVVGRQSPPVFALYWDKKLQFSLQGRTALWDSILLLCHRVQVGYGGVVRGMHLGSSALNILQVLDSETED